MKTVMIVDDTSDIYSPECLAVRQRYQKDYYTLTTHDIYDDIGESKRLKIYKTFIDVADVVHFANINVNSDMNKSLLEYAENMNKTIIKDNEFANDLDKLTYYVDKISMAKSKGELDRLENFEEMFNFVITMLLRAEYSKKKVKKNGVGTQQLAIEFEEKDSEAE